MLRHRPYLIVCAKTHTVFEGLYPNVWCRKLVDTPGLAGFLHQPTNISRVLSVQLCFYKIASMLQSYVSNKLSMKTQIGFRDLLVS